jgi:nucleoside-diphosphate-sugar epimerase
LTECWRDLFNAHARFDLLLYDLTTYFEAGPPFAEGDKRRFGYSRDHRPDCVQVVIALVVTPEGLPLAYEVLSGNTSDKTTLRDFLARIERQFGKVFRYPAVAGSDGKADCTVADSSRPTIPARSAIRPGSARLTRGSRALCVSFVKYAARVRRAGASRGAMVQSRLQR